MLVHVTYFQQVMFALTTTVRHMFSVKCAILYCFCALISLKLFEYYPVCMAGYLHFVYLYWYQAWLLPCIDCWPPTGNSWILINGVMGAISTSSNGYNSNCFGFVGNNFLFVIDHFYTKPLLRSHLHELQTHSASATFYEQILILCWLQLCNSCYLVLWTMFVDIQYIHIHT